MGDETVSVVAEEGWEPAGAPPYRPSRPFGVVAQVGLAAVAVVASGAVVASVAHYVFVDSHLADPTSTLILERLRVSDLWLGLFTVLVVLVGIPAAGAFIAWVWRAHANLPSLGVQELRFSPGWAVGSWFVPVLNLVWPKLIVDGIWRDSDPDAPEVVAVPDDRGTVPLAVHLWWGLVVVILLGWILAPLASAGELIGPTRERLPAAFQILSSAALVAAAVLAYGLIGDVDARQEERTRRLGIDPTSGRRPEPTVVQPLVAQRAVPGFPPPPSLPPVRLSGSSPAPPVVHPTGVAFPDRPPQRAEEPDAGDG